MHPSDERESFSLRLLESLEKKGLSGHGPTTLARAFNRRYAGRPVTVHAARKWLLGEAIPAQDKLLVLARWLGVTPEWLRFGEQQTAVLTPRETAPDYDFQLMRDIAALPPGHQHVVRVLVRELGDLPDCKATTP